MWWLHLWRHLFFFSFFFRLLNPLKMHGNLGGKADPSELPILLIKNTIPYFFPPSQHSLRMFEAFPLNIYSHVASFCLLLVIWWLAFLISRVTSGHLVAPTVSSSPLCLRCICVRRALPNIKFNYKSAFPLLSVWKHCFIREVKCWTSCSPLPQNFKISQLRYSFFVFRPLLNKYIHSLHSLLNENMRLYAHIFIRTFPFLSNCILSQEYRKV